MKSRTERSSLTSMLSSVAFSLSELKLRFHNIVLAAVLIFSIGGHWAILQSGAWVGMFISFSQTGSVTEAVVKTFDGNHPCKVCHLVSEGKRAEKKDEHQLNKGKIDLFFLKNDALFLTRTFFDFSAETRFPFSSFTASPPTPPPKRFSSLPTV